LIVVVATVGVTLEQAAGSGAAGIIPIR